MFLEMKLNKMKEPYFITKLSDNWQKEFAFICENRQKIASETKFNTLKESIREKKRILCAIEVIEFDETNPGHSLPNGEYGLLDLDFNKIDDEDIHHVKYLVVDGQHRILAYRELCRDMEKVDDECDIRIKVSVDPITVRNDVYHMNNTSTPWILYDYVESYAESGIQENRYKILLKKIHDGRSAGIKDKKGNDIAYYYAKEKKGSEVLKWIKELDYEVDEKKGDDVIDAMKTLSVVLEDDAYGQSFGRNIMLLQRKYPLSFDAKRLARILIDYPGDLFRNKDGTKVGKKQMLDEMERILWESFDKNPSADSFSNDQAIVIAERDRNRQGEIACSGKRCRVKGEIINGRLNRQLLEVDHKIPNNGVNTIVSNGELLCPDCNKNKSNIREEAISKLSI